MLPGFPEAPLNTRHPRAIHPSARIKASHT